MIRRPPNSPLFPYPTLFRPRRAVHEPVVVDVDRAGRQREPAHRRHVEPDDIPRGYRAREAAVRVVVLVHGPPVAARDRSEEHTSELQSLAYLVCRLLLEKKN